MATDPKKDECEGSKIADEQLENVAGGKKIPTSGIGRSRSASELSDGDLGNVSGGQGRPVSRKGNQTAEEAPN